MNFDEEDEQDEKAHQFFKFIKNNNTKTKWLVVLWFPNVFFSLMIIKVYLFTFLHFSLSSFLYNQYFIKLLKQIACLSKTTLESNDVKTCPCTCTCTCPNSVRGRLFSFKRWSSSIVYIFQICVFSIYLSSILSSNFQTARYRHSGSTPMIFRVVTLTRFGIPPTAYRLSPVSVTNALTVLLGTRSLYGSGIVDEVGVLYLNIPILPQ